jgi:CBS domain-containing protein
MLAIDIMTKDVIAVSPLTPVANLATILNKNHISGAPVLDENGKVIGIVSEADLIARKGKQVKSIMSTRVIEARETTTVEEIASLMITHKVKRMPIMRGEKMAGIVSRADIVRAIAIGEHIAMHTPIYDL